MPIQPRAKTDAAEMGCATSSPKAAQQGDVMQDSDLSERLLVKRLKPAGRRETNDIDKFVGDRIRHYRAMTGISQQKLAESLGVTFQQLQKYERGENRIGAGRLLMAANALGIPITFLLDQDAVEQRKTGAPPLEAEGAEALRDAYSIGRAFAQITDPAVRKSITTLVRILADQSETP
jgi:transcriptional regulator with XRE-family HTH domain